MMPGLPVSDIDVLYVDALGKNYSGTGMDTNVIGRFRILGVEEPETPAVKYVIVGDISEESHGNALGVGLADLTTRRLADQIEHKAMNANVVTSTFIERAKVPMVLASDEEALQTAVRCNWGVPPEETRFVRIPNTLHLEYLYVSENLVDEVLRNAETEVVGDAERRALRRRRAFRRVLSGSRSALRAADVLWAPGKGAVDFASLAGARVVDLSLTVSERLPGTWPGHMTYAHHNWNWFAEVERPNRQDQEHRPLPDQLRRHGRALRHPLRRPDPLRPAPRLWPGSRRTPRGSNRGQSTSRRPDGSRGRC